MLNVQAFCTTAGSTTIQLNFSNFFSTHSHLHLLKVHFLHLHATVAYPLSHKAPDLRKKYSQSHILVQLVTYHTAVGMVIHTINMMLHTMSQESQGLTTLQL
jgi:hypothetical protein